MTTEQNKAFIQQRTQFMNQHDLESILALFSPEYLDHDAPPPRLPSGMEGDKI